MTLYAVFEGSVNAKLVGLYSSKQLARKAMREAAAAAKKAGKQTYFHMPLQPIIVDTSIKI